MSCVDRMSWRMLGVPLCRLLWAALRHGCCRHCWTCLSCSEGNQFFQHLSSLDLNNDLPLRTPLSQIFKCLFGLPEWKHLVDHGANTF